MNRTFTMFAAITWPLTAFAQQIPGRDLFDFPVGSVAEGFALALRSGDGLRNPAGILLPDGAAGRLTASSLLTGSTQGVSAQILGGALQWRGTTYGVTVARASVGDIPHTDSDPQSVGTDVPYNALVVSALAARRQTRDLYAGVALRFLRGELDLTTRSAFGLDAGVVAEHLTTADARIAVSSFLWRPAAESGDGQTFSASGDFRAIGDDDTRSARPGYSFSLRPGLSREQYVFASGRYLAWEMRTGIAWTEAFSHSTTRWRLAVGTYVGRYFAAIAREDSPVGLAASYQFTLTTLIPQR
ncbi:MAG: hypothetical protein MNPFHGCM_00987 [Gemmatimonadaceae bacterium]|nr:hypothetical protein [Gemmatimonadaceae bacterium]